MTKYQHTEDQMVELDIEGKENEDIVSEGDIEEELKNIYDLCLVGRFLTEKNVNVRAMKSKITDIWK